MTPAPQAGRQVNPVKSPLAAALEQLQLERTNLAARLAKVDDLIFRMRDVCHLPAERSAKTIPAAVNGHDHGEISADAIRTALQAGPLSPGALATQLHVPRLPLRRQCAALALEGVLVITGTKAGRRIALVGRQAPAKEAP